MTMSFFRNATLLLAAFFAYGLILGALPDAVHCHTTNGVEVCK